MNDKYAVMPARDLKKKISQLFTQIDEVIGDMKQVKKLKCLVNISLDRNVDYETNLKDFSASDDSE